MGKIIPERINQMKKTKFKNVVQAHNIYGLISIACNHERRGTDIWDEYYFLNNELDVVAHFESMGDMRASQLSELNDHIFKINNWSDNNNRKTQIVRVNQDLSYEVLHEVDDDGMMVMDGTLAIKKNGLWGFIDYNGEEIIKPQYYDVFSFKNGYACVKQNDKWGFINKKNEVVIPFEYDIPKYCIKGDNPAKYLIGGSCFTNHNGKFLAEVAKGDKWGIIDLNNNVVLPFKYDWLCLTSGNYIAAKLNDKWGFIDINDNIIVPFIYDDVEQDGNDLPYYTAVKDGLTGLFSFDKGMIIPCEYKELEPYHNIICAQKQNGQHVLLSYDNKELSEEYSDIISYPNLGLYLTCKDKKYYGYINEQGEIIVPFRYKGCSRIFIGGLAIAEYPDYKKGVDVINTKGEVLYHAKMPNDVFNVGNGYILAENDNNEYEFIKLI